MESKLIHLFEANPQLALFISIFLGILIAIAGILPSFFLTAANILFFGFWEGTMLSFLGEALGAAIAFILYRNGFKGSLQNGLKKHPRLNELLGSKGKDAFLLIFSLRLIPFVPSGLITFAAAIGKVSFRDFFAASTLGKFPALLLEAYAVYEVTQFGWQGRTILVVIGLLLLYSIIKKKVS